MMMAMKVQGRVQELHEEQSQRRVTAATNLKKQTAVLYLVPRGSDCPAISARAAAAPLEKVTKREGRGLGLKMVVRMCPPKGGSPCPCCPPLLFPHLSSLLIAALQAVDVHA